MKIPKRVDACWDWAERHIRGLAVTVVVTVAVVGALLLPVLAALALGVLAGGAAVYSLMAVRLRRLRVENDTLLRENGALRHERTVLAQGVIATDTEPTAQLMIIPAEPQETRRLDILPEDEPENGEPGVEKVRR